MKQHIIPSIVASLVATAAAVGFSHVTRAPEVTRVVSAPAGAISPARAARLAKVVWPELEQQEVDALTARLKTVPPTMVTIFCIEDSKCGDLVLSLDNAFEAAHWGTILQNSPMVPPGIISSSQKLVDAIRGTTSLDIRIDVENNNAGPGEYIAIGARP